jgi:hypothetical protein
MKSLRKAFDEELRREHLREMLSEKRSIKPAESLHKTTITDEPDSESIISRLFKMQEEQEETKHLIESLVEEVAASAKTGNCAALVASVKNLRTVVHQKYTNGKQIDTECAEILTEPDTLKLLFGFLSPIYESQEDLLKEVIWVLIDLCSTKKIDLINDITDCGIVATLHRLLTSNISASIYCEVALGSPRRSSASSTS